MNPQASSSSISPAKPTFACISCSERKVRCDKEDPCNACVRHRVKCVYRPPDPSRKKRKIVSVRDSSIDERLKHFETLLKEKGIDPQQSVGPSDEDYSRESKRSEVPVTVWQLPTPVSAVSGPQTTIFKPRLIHGQRGTELVDK